MFYSEYDMGNFNIDLLKYKCCIRSYSINLFNQLSSSIYMPLITKPTRIAKSTAALIATSSQTMLIKQGIKVAPY